MWHPSSILPRYRRHPVEGVPLRVMLPRSKELPMTCLTQVEIWALRTLPPRASDGALTAPIASHQFVHLTGRSLGCNRRSRRGRWSRWNAGRAPASLARTSSR